MASSRKALTLAKLEAFQQLVDAGLLSKEALQANLSDAVEKGDITALTEKSFEGKAESLLAFAKEFGLVKEAGAPVGGGVHRTGYLHIIKTQHPETASAIDAMNEISKKSYEITLEDGSKITVQPMPFARNLSPKKEDTSKKDGVVTV